ncbi:MAG: porin family protein [Porticoccaceae bacterium]|jgi:hypothetical protein|nr:MAG: porin [SAR92 bacterium BACL16 MAG-120619-bin48]MDP4655067.1 porin family protein [Alphaproteobacteria bacterium]MDP4743555.1 porin family protein [Porticoccaceae bacterium]MDP4752394.1 porin family protein [Porticoccaceae bacterium]MDP4890575.1 porin family protein [Porticoccaceae bacterium]
MIKKTLIVGALSSIVSWSALAADSPLSYSNAGIGYMTGDIADVDFSGFGVYGSYALNDSFFVIGDYTSISSDDSFDFGFGVDDIEATQINVGFGFHTPISDATDFVATLSYADAEVEFFDLTEDGNGYIMSAGVRAKPTQEIELQAFLNYADIEDGSETGYLLGARYFTMPTLSLGLNYGSSDDFDSFSFDVRFDF